MGQYVKGRKAAKAKVDAKRRDFAYLRGVAAYGAGQPNDPASDAALVAHQRTHKTGRLEKFAQGRAFRAGWDAAKFDAEWKAAKN